MGRRNEGGVGKEMILWQGPYKNILLNSQRPFGWVKSQILVTPEETEGGGALLQVFWPAIPPNSK